MDKPYRVEFAGIKDPAWNVLSNHATLKSACQKAERHVRFMRAGKSLRVVGPDGPECTYTAPDRVVIGRALSDDVGAGDHCAKGRNTG